MLGRLERDGDTHRLGELTGPHAGTVHDVLGLDVTMRGADAGDRLAAGQEAGRGHALEDPHAQLAGALGQRHGDVYRVDPAVLLDVEAGQDVVGVGEREQLLHLTGGDLLDVDAAEPVESRDAAVLLEAVGIGRHLDEAHGLESGRQSGLRLQPAVEIARVLPHLRRGLRGGAERHHEPGGVPGRSGREPVALEEHHVGPAEVGEVVRERGTDHATADDDDAGAVRNGGGSREGTGHATIMAAPPAPFRSP